MRVLQQRNDFETEIFKNFKDNQTLEPIIDTGVSLLHFLSFLFISEIASNILCGKGRLLIRMEK
jgi:hypothetical protein